MVLYEKQRDDDNNIADSAGLSKCSSKTQCWPQWHCLWGCELCSRVNRCCFTFTKWKETCHLFVAKFEGYLDSNGAHPDVEKWLPCHLIPNIKGTQVKLSDGTYNYGHLALCI